MEYFRNETECKQVMDTLLSTSPSAADKVVWVPGPIIVGGGPSGLALAACLEMKSIPCVVLERSHCVASLWQLKTYDRLHLHLPKQFCELPMRPFPASYPTYPSKPQFVAYLEAYAREFSIQPRFGESVVCAEFDGAMGFWRVRTVSREGVQREYLARWVVAATGENAEVVIPEIEGAVDFQGLMLHSSLYRRGDVFRGKNVLVVGCGNSGMEVCLDLCNHEARPTLVVRDTVHVLPREMFGVSTFGLSMWLLKWLPMKVADRLVLLLSYFLIGNTAKLGLPRPEIGPFQLKTQSGKTPVIDVGTLQKIKSGYVKVRPGIKRFTEQGVEFVDGRIEEIDAVLLATGFRSNVPSWLKDDKLFSKDGLPKRPFPNGWKGERGLYAVGFTQRGLLGASTDAKNVAEDIERCWVADIKNAAAFSQPPMKQEP